MNLVDPDVLIDVWRGHPPAVQWFATCSDVPAVPGFVVMELVQDARNRGQVQQALNLVQPLEIVWPSEADCGVALNNFVTFRLSHGLGLIDSLIAASAVGLNATLFTFNKKHFRFIPGLTVAEPYRR